MVLGPTNANTNNEAATTAPRRNRTVEQTYTKLSQLEHVLVRPDTYVGSVERMQQTTWVWDSQNNCMVHKEISYPPGLYKIFDEILVNAADHAQRDSTMDSLKVEIDPENLTISVWNNGSGIPVEIHKKEKIYVPELIFGHLLTSSNYDDDEKKVVGGRNGFGAKLANIFSTEFIVETADAVNGKKFKQVFRDNMNSKDDPIIRANPKKEAYTKITFSPDLARFSLTYLDDDVVSIMKKRVYDIAGINSSLKVYLNGSKLNIKTFKDYVALYPTDAESPVAHERLDDRWEVAITASDGQLSQVSFVNSIWTIKGGTHVGHVADCIVAKIAEHIQKKNKGITVKPFQIKSHLSLFVNCLVENPSFDSQTKETLTSKPSKFGSKWTFSDELAKKVISKTNIVDNVLAFARFKQDKELAKTDGGKKARVTGIPKLDDANKAGSREASKCTLILTEGDSAKSLAVSGLSVVGRDYFGVYPLRGKLLNVREAKHKQIMDNVEINHLKKIVGLQQNKKYDEESIKSLRYGHVLIMTDQDHDGSHIKGLVINFFDHFWPSLLRVEGFLQEFITPIVKCTKGRENRVFFTLPQYKNWVDSQEGNQRGWYPKYYKGLGTSTAAEAKGYFSDLTKHLHQFSYNGPEDSDNIELAFSKQRVNDRKDWLSSFEPGTFFDHDEDELNYTNFVNKELILFSIADNSRSIPNMVDGFKPSQRKVLYACFKRKLTKNEIKVAQLAGYVSEHAAYHHGEMSLQATIVGLAQNFVGSNNINLLVPAGQFGTRLQGGKDAASSRYIFTKLAPIARALIPELDDRLLSYLEEDGMSIEPKWYCPIIPLVLVNGSDGIGTGWSSSIPCYNPRDLIRNIRRLLNGQPVEKMSPWYRGFHGSIVPVENSKSYDIYGNLKRSNELNSFKIDELPIRSWTGPYKEFLDASMIGNNDAKAPFVKDFQDNGTENKVNFTFTTTNEQAAELGTSAAYKKLKLSTTISTNNMVLFDAEGRICKYDTPEDIVKDFFNIRLRLYDERRVYLLRELEQELLCLDNKQRFITMVVDGKLKVAKRKKVDLIKELERLKFDKIQKKKTGLRSTDQPPENENNDGDENNDNKGDEGISEKESGYDYLLSMALWSLTNERVRQLVVQRDGKAKQKEEMEMTTGKELWEEELRTLEDALVKDEDIAKHLADDLDRASKAAKVKQRRGGGKRKGQKAIVYQTSDNEDLELVDIPSVRTITAKVPRVKKTLTSVPKSTSTRKRTSNDGGTKKRGSGSSSGSRKKDSIELSDEESDMDFSEHSDGDDDVIIEEDNKSKADADGISDVLAGMNLEKNATKPRPTRRAQHQRKATKAIYIDVSDDEGNQDMDSEDDDDFELTVEDKPSKKPAGRKIAAKPATTSKEKKVDFSFEFDEDLDDIQPVVKRPSASSSGVARSKKKVSILDPPSSARSNITATKKSTKSIVVMNDDEDEDDPSSSDVELSLADRLAARNSSSSVLPASTSSATSKKAGKSTNAATKRGSVPKSKATMETLGFELSPGKSPKPKKTRLKSPAVAKKTTKRTGGKKGRKIAAVSDDDDEGEVGDDENEDAVNETLSPAPAVPTTRPRRAVSRKVTIDVDAFDEDEDDDEEAEIIDDDDDSDFE